MRTFAEQKKRTKVRRYFFTTYHVWDFGPAGKSNSKFNRNKGTLKPRARGNARVSGTTDAISAGPNISLANKRLFRARSEVIDTQL